jgi:hypothetical protein
MHSGPTSPYHECDPQAGRRWTGRPHRTGVKRKAPGHVLPGATFARYHYITCCARNLQSLSHEFIKFRYTLSLACSHAAGSGPAAR